MVGNRSAVGEQYVELQPQVDTAPYLRDDSEIANEDTRTPIPTEKLLADVSNTVSSVDQKALAVTVDELGQAFAGTGEDLQRIIDTGNSFIQEANANFDVTTALIRDSNTVLSTQADSASAIRNFAQEMSLFTTSLAGDDPSLRKVIDDGSAAAVELRTFLEDNEVDLGELINNLVTTGDVIVKHLAGVRQILSIYPYVVEGGFSVVSKSPDTGLYDAHFGLILTTTPVCHAGYQGTDTRPAAGRVQPADEHQRPLHRAADHEQRTRRPEPRPGRRGLPRPGRVVRPGHRPAALGQPDRPGPRPAGHARPTDFRRGLVEVAISPAVDQYPEVTTVDPQPEDQPNPTFRLVLLVVLLVVLIASAAVLGWLLVDRRGEASDAQAEREAVMSQTKQFMLRLNTYGPDQVDADGHLTEYQDAGHRGDHPEVRRGLHQRTASRSPRRR